MLGENTFQHKTVLFINALLRTAPGSVSFFLLPWAGSPSLPGNADLVLKHCVFGVLAAAPAYMGGGHSMETPANNLELAFKDKEESGSLRKCSALSLGMTVRYIHAL